MCDRWIGKQREREGAGKETCDVAEGAGKETCDVAKGAGNKNGKQHIREWNQG